jgi:hypothetical protein
MKRERLIGPVPLPAGALLRSYADAGAYTDCFATDIPCRVAFPAFVEAFYTTPLFRLERWILAAMLQRSSTDDEARDLAAGRRERFAAWDTEARADDQLLMCDMHRRTRSWFMVTGGESTGSTRLYFGSAVVPLSRATDGARRMGSAFELLLPFHKAYARLLLAAARGRVLSQAAS